METIEDYFNGTPRERVQIVRRAGIEPPNTQTHRGKPAEWALQGYAEATKPKRTPTHRTPGAPVTPAWTRNLLAAIGKAPGNA